MRMLRRSKIWVLLSLLSMLGVVVTPALAFNCCCTSPSLAALNPLAARNSQVEPNAQLKPAMSQPTCHGRVVQAVVSKAEKPCHSHQKTPSPQPGGQTAPDVATISDTSVEAVCDCLQVETPPATPTETVSAFSSLGLYAVVPLARWNVATPELQRVWLPDDRAAGPRGPTLSPHHGRAPPAI
jgi:hypothetical protein